MLFCIISAYISTSLHKSRLMMLLYRHFLPNVNHFLCFFVIFSSIYIPNSTFLSFLFIQFAQSHTRISPGCPFYIFAVLPHPRCFLRWYVPNHLPHIPQRRYDLPDCIRLSWVSLRFQDNRIVLRTN